MNSNPLVKEQPIMTLKPFPIEKIFGSRTRVKVITLFTTGVNRPYYVREIAREINERLNAVRRELDILQKIGMLSSYDHKRRKYYTVKKDFVLLNELTSIMRKSGPPIEDSLFKHLPRVGEVYYACASGVFTGAENSPTDLLLIGNIDEQKLKAFTRRIERQIDREISYTPITLNEYRYRRNFNDIFLKQIFSAPFTEIINRLTADLQPASAAKKTPTFA